MEYTVQKLAGLAGVSARTLRYYDQIGLLSPTRIRENGYRVYGEREIDALQQIMFFRELGSPLEEIATLIKDPGFDVVESLKRHHNELIKRRLRIDMLIANVEKTIESRERGIVMNDNEKFDGFKQTLIDENEAKYGDEIRGKYGNEQVEASNMKFKSMTQEQFGEMQRLGEEVIKKLDEAFADGSSKSEKARELAETHKRWLSYTWDKYSPEAHAGLARMYADDERFAEHYNRGEKGKAEFMRDAILALLEQ